MNFDKFKEGLRSKIDSFDKWKELVLASGGNPAGRVVDIPEMGFRMSFNDTAIGRANNLKPEHRWWMEREAYRVHAGIYPAPTDVLSQLVANFGLHQHFVHLSAEDPNMVAYTASVEDGLRDKQVRLSFGKLIRKLLLLVTDDHIRELEAAHRSEMDPTFLIARTPEEIGRVYMTMQGDSGCMRYTPDTWDLPKNVHPSHVYSYAGIGVAYIQDEQGRVKSRTVIYENPDKPEDKRYVRMYGDGALKRKLERAGYRCDHLAGAKLKAIHLHDLPRVGKKWSAGTYLMPYLDGMGGNQENRDGSWGYMVKGEDCIRLLTVEQRNRMASMGFACTQFRSTSVAHILHPIEAERLEFTCALSGRKVNAMDEESVRYWHEDKVVSVARTSLPPRCLSARNASAAGTVEPVYYAAANPPPMFEDVERVGGMFIESEANRLFCGYAKLNPEFYPDEQGWMPARKLLRTLDGTFLKYEDAYLVFDADGNTTHAHVGAIDGFKKAKTHVSVAPVGKTKAVSHVNNPNLHTTVGGRKVVFGTHAVVQLVDGTWEFAVNAYRAWMHDKEIWVVRENASKPETWRWAEEVANRMFVKDLVFYVEADWSLSERPARLRQYVRDHLCCAFQNYSFYCRSDTLVKHSGQSTADYESVKKAALRLKAMSDTEITDMFYPDIVPEARGWEQNTNVVIKLVEEHVARWTAEAASTQVQVGEVASTHETSYAIAA